MNSTLHKARQIKNDEFYTPMDLVKKLIDPFIPQLKNKRIICPCDSAESNIYIYIKSLGLNVERATIFQHVKYSDYDVVITNPPFSKMKEFMGYIMHKDYILITFWLLISYNWFAEHFLDKIYFINGEKIKFTNQEKKVHVNFITTLPPPKNWQSRTLWDIRDGKIYSMAALEHCSRKDFACITLKENNQLSFKKLIYGKTNQWIIDNIPNLYEISFNNFDKNYHTINIEKIKANEGQLTLW